MAGRPGVVGGGAHGHTLALDRPSGQGGAHFGGPDGDVEPEHRRRRGAPVGVGDGEVKIHDAGPEIGAAQLDDTVGVLPAVGQLPQVTQRRGAAGHDRLHRQRVPLPRGGIFVPTKGCPATSSTSFAPSNTPFGKEHRDGLRDGGKRAEGRKQESYPKE